MEADRRLRALRAHPDLSAAYDPSTLASLEAVLVELARFGECTLGAHDDRAGGELTVAWTATLRLRGGTGDPLMAHAPSAMLAATYLLMEALAEARRQAAAALDRLADDI